MLTKSITEFRKNPAYKNINSSSSINIKMFHAILSKEIKEESLRVKDKRDNERREQGYCCPKCKSVKIHVGMGRGGRRQTPQEAWCDDCEHIWEWDDPSIEANARAYGDWPDSSDE